MGMISLFEQMPEAALKYFNKELEIAMRARSLESVMQLWEKNRLYPFYVIARQKKAGITLKK
jgi:hypothetical protein